MYCFKINKSYNLLYEISEGICVINQILQPQSKHLYK